MSAIDTLFTSLRSQGRKALMPFITAGDPDMGFTTRVIRELAARGCHLCELGIPYSDPIADGPVIQSSYTRALENKITLAEIFNSVASVTPEVTMPIVSMVSYAIVYRRGLEEYVRQAIAAGVSGAIVPDLPAEEAKELAAVCRQADFSLIQLITPTTSRERALKIAETSTGFIYYVSVTGITGERTALPTELSDNVAWLRTQTELPICIGFGINKPEHVRLLAPVCDGLIVGSAIVRRISAAQDSSREKALADVGDYVSGLLEAFDG